MNVPEDTFLKLISISSHHQINFLFLKVSNWRLWFLS